jgi:predicted PurR-regulated permease PerM
MEAKLKIPFYARAALIFISAFALIFTLYIGKDIIIPLIYAIIIAVLLNPMVNYLMKMKISRVISIAVAVTIAILAVLSIFYVLLTQFSMLSESYPQLKEKFNQTSSELVQWISEKFNIRVSKINAWKKETQSDVINDFALAESLTEAGQLIMTVMLLPVYLFMILYYKPLLVEFIRRLFRTEHQNVISEILTSTKRIIQTYLIGLFFELLIVAILNSAGLLLLGIQYAVILGIIGAILNLIPYLGGIIAIALPMIIAFITKDSISSPILVFCVYGLIQFIDNNFIIPKIVASRVRINALISIIVVFIGGSIWGVSGMFLSIPIIAIIKVICDQIEVLKPWGFLLGDIIPTTPNFALIKKAKRILIKSTERL